MAKRGVRFLGVGGRTDDAWQCNRFKAAYRHKVRELLKKLMEDNPDVEMARLLYFGTKCMTRLFKGILVTGAWGNAMASSMYWKSHVLSRTHFYIKLTSGPRGLALEMETPLLVEPDQEDVVNNADVMGATHLRPFRTRGRAVGDLILDTKEEDAVQESGEFRTFYNGKCARPGKLVHKCKGPSRICRGRRTRAVDYGTGPLGKKFTRKTPPPGSVSKFWTQQLNLVCQVFVHLFLDIGATWACRAFAGATAPDAPADEAMDGPIQAWRRYLCRQVVSTCDKADDLGHKRHPLILLAVSEALDVLDGYMQHAGQHGGVLWEFTDPRGPLAKMQQTLASMSDGTSRTVQMLGRHFAERGEREWDLFMTELDDVVFSVAAQIWTSAEAEHTGCPRRLCRARAPNVSTADQNLVCQQAFDGPACGKDKEFTRELIEGLSGPGKLMGSEVVGSPIETMGKVTQPTNMGMENFLAVVRGVADLSKRRPCIGRLNCAAHLASLMQICKDNGGVDYRREDADFDDGPVQTRSKQSKAARENHKNKWKRTNAFIGYAKHACADWATEQEISGGDVPSGTGYSGGPGQVGQNDHSGEGAARREGTPEQSAPQGWHLGDHEPLRRTSEVGIDAL